MLLGVMVGSDLSTADGLLDGGENVGVVAAATDVAVHGLDDLGPRRLGVTLGEGDGRHDVTRDAVAALHRLLIEESLLDGVQLAVRRNAFDRPDFPTVRFADSGAAGADGLAVEKDGAGAAFTLAAAELGAGEVEVLAKDVQ